MISDAEIRRVLAWERNWFRRVKQTALDEVGREDGRGAVLPKLKGEIAMSKTEGMTVKQAIEFLSNLPDKSIMLMIDCPHCGRGNQLAKISEAVILSSHEEKP